MRAARFSVVLFGVALMWMIALSMVTIEPRPEPINAEPVRFDHSNCQYPDRWTNPANGCDNSDPAVPECIKAFHTKESENACIAEFVKRNDPKPAIIENEPVMDELPPMEGGK